MKVIVGMSGGVDSSVSAALLLEQGHEVEGLFMFNWAEDEDGYCTAQEDFDEASKVADELNIPLHRADFSKQYREQVFQYFLDEYAAGFTPNPDVLCNREIKFKTFLDYALKLGAVRIATGHYAAVCDGPDGTELHRASDMNKDQTYFLAAVDQAALSRTLFPLGQLDKPEVRRMAEARGFDNYARKDSTGICFIGERPFQHFLAGYLPAEPGPIINIDNGQSIGEHQGLMYKTLGQRKGLGIGGRADASEAPWYVVDKTLADKTLWVSQNPDHPRLLSRSLIVESPHWIGAPPENGRQLTCQIRHRQRAQACHIEYDKATTLKLTFETPQRAATPGQWAVLYDGPRCLGGGRINAIQTCE